MSHGGRRYRGGAFSPFMAWPVESSASLPRKGGRGPYALSPPPLGLYSHLHAKRSEAAFLPGSRCHRVLRPWSSSSLLGLTDGVGEGSCIKRKKKKRAQRGKSNSLLRSSAMLCPIHQGISHIPTTKSLLYRADLQTKLKIKKSPQQISFLAHFRRLQKGPSESGGDGPAADEGKNRQKIEQKVAGEGMGRKHTRRNFP